MRILIISYFFPPFNCIGSIRIGKTAKYLMRLGNDVRIVTCKQQMLPENLPVEIPEDRIIYTSWFNLNRPLQLVLNKKEIVNTGYSVPRSPFGNLLKILGQFYKTSINFPDAQAGWIPFAYTNATKLIKEWRPDLIFSSGLPISSLLAAALVSHRQHVPWIAELRDLWVGNPYRFMPGWRRLLEQRLEKKIFSRVWGLVTVSEPLASELHQKYSLPVSVITNGFDEDDFMQVSRAPSETSSLAIAYTGMVYEGRQHPEPLFKALKKLKEKFGININVNFYGRYLQLIEELAKSHGIEDLISVHGPIPYREAISIQAGSDILLLFLGYGEAERGVFTGKFFEYLRTTRPILAIGSSNNVAAHVITSRNAGFVSDNPDAIMHQLLKWHEEKEKRGVVPSSPDSVYAGFSRREQTEKLLEFFRQCLTA